VVLYHHAFRHWPPFGSLCCKRSSPCFHHHILPPRLALPPPPPSLWYKHRGTLVICPVVAVIQWRQEIARYTAAGSVKVLLYHGAKRGSITPVELQAADVVLTTYSTLENDYRRCVMPAKVACRWVFSEPMLDRLGEWGWGGQGRRPGVGVWKVGTLLVVCCISVCTFLLPHGTSSFDSLCPPPPHPPPHHVHPPATATRSSSPPSCQRT
jgi:hypothetical protein